MLQCFAEERLRCGNVPSAAEVGCYGLAMFIHRPVQVHPSAADQNICLVAAPRLTYRLFERAHRLGEVNRIADDPAENRAGCNRDAKLVHDLRQISVAQLKSQIPVDTLNDGVIGEPALSKQWVANLSTGTSHIPFLPSKVQQIPLRVTNAT